MLCFVNLGGAELEFSTIPELVGLMYNSVSIVVLVPRVSTVIKVSRNGTPDPPPPPRMLNREFYSIVNRVHVLQKLH